MIWLGSIIGIMVGVVILLLAVPIKIRLVWAPDQKKIIFRYLGFGRTTDFAAGVNIIDWLGLRLFRSEISPEPVAEKKRKPKVKKEKVKKPRIRLAKSLSAHRQTLVRVLTRAVVLSWRLLLSPRLRLFRLDITAGSGNPAVTGMYYGWFNAVRPAWASDRVRVNWQPVFDRAHFAARFDGRLWLSPWRPVRRTMQFIWELPKRGLYRLYKELKKKEA